MLAKLEELDSALGYHAVPHHVLLKLRWWSPCARTVPHALGLSREYLVGFGLPGS